MIVTHEATVKGMALSVGIGAFVAGFIIVGLLLSGCAETPVEQSCASYGFTPGTTAFAGCVQDEIRDRRAMMRGFGEDIERQTDPRRGRY